jgi:hypothetical protein
MSQNRATSPAVVMADLPYLVRRVLRLVAQHSSIPELELEVLADLDQGIHSETSLLIMHGLIARRPDRSYWVTEAGAECVKTDPQRRADHTQRPFIAINHHPRALAESLPPGKEGYDLTGYRLDKVFLDGVELVTSSPRCVGHSVPMSERRK